MENLQYLFSFDFEYGCMNDYVINFCRRTKTDYFRNHFGVIYADLFGTGNYFKIIIIDVIGDRKEVYYNPAKIERNYFDRLYPKIEKVVDTRPNSNTYCIKAVFENGDFVTTRVNGCKKTIENYYLNNIFDLSGDPEKEYFVKCTSVEFLKAV